MRLPSAGGLAALTREQVHAHLALHGIVIPAGLKAFIINAEQYDLLMGDPRAYCSEDLWPCVALQNKAFVREDHVCLGEFT